MSRIYTIPRILSAAMLSACLTAWSVTPALAQSGAGEYDERYTDAGYDHGAGDIVILSPQELDGLVGPIALYPDDLLAIVLPASTYPLDIVQAARFLDELEDKPSLKPDEDWDESVTALLNYPEVVRLMNEDIDWTWELGGAVLNQQADVIAAVERFRDRAYAAGNLSSDDYQTVNNDGDAIEILPADERVIYVPYYEPREVVVRQVERVYYYYPQPRPVYYYPYPAGHAFFDSWFWGVSTAYRIGWSGRHLNVWHYTFRGHPYFGHYYSGRHYRCPSIAIYNHRYVNSSGRYAADRYRHGDRWRPRRGHRARPVGSRPHRAVHRGRDSRPGLSQRRPAIRNEVVRRPARPARTPEEIRLRERPDTVTAGVRRGSRDVAQTEDLRRRHRASPTRATQTRAPQIRPPARAGATRDSVRPPVQRNTDRAAARPRVARTPPVATNNAPAVRKPARPARAPEAPRQRPDNAASRNADDKRKSGPGARQRAQSRAETGPAGRQRKHRR